MLRGQFAGIFSKHNRRKGLASVEEGTNTEEYCYAKMILSINILFLLYYYESKYFCIVLFLYSLFLLSIYKNYRNNVFIFVEKNMLSSFNILNIYQ